MKLYAAGFGLLLVSAAILLVSAAGRSLSEGLSWASIACSVAAAGFAVAGVLRSRSS